MLTDSNPEKELHELHIENRKAISALHNQLDILIRQTEEQSLALRMIVGCPLNDTDGLLRFREEHQRFLRYDRRISSASEAIAEWMVRMFLIGGILLVVWGMAAVGFFDMVKSIARN